MFNIASVLNSARFDLIRFVTNLKLTFNWFPLGLQCSRVLTYFSLAKMASEAQKPPAKMEFLLVCGLLATVSLEP